MKPDRVIAATAAQALYSAARAHKRQEAHHRRQARALMQKVEQLRADLAAYGITLILDDTAREAQS